MRIKRSAVVATTMVVMAPALSVVAQAADPHSGTWKMNPGKSKYNPGPAAKSVILTVAADENDINAEGTDGDGNSTHVE